MSTLTILCVDDEPTVLLTLRSQLSRHFPHYTIEIAESATEALECVEKLLAVGRKIPLVIVDQTVLGLPENELFIELYARQPEILTVILTEQSPAKDVGHVVNPGNLYRLITKPWDEIDLTLTVTEAIRRYQQDQQLIQQQLALEQANQKLEKLNAALEQRVKEGTQQRDELEQQLRVFVEYTPAAVAMFDRTMHYLLASRRWREEYHLDDQIIGQSYYDRFPDLPDRWQEIHQRCLAGAVEQCEEDCWVRADGSQIWTAWEIRPWYTEADEIGGIIMFTQIITDRKQSEIALRASETQLRSIFNSAFQLIALSSPTGQLLSANKTALTFTDLRIEEIKAKLLWELPCFRHLPDVQVQVRQGLLAAVAGELYQVEAQIEGKDGAILDLATSFKPLFDQSGQVYQVLIEGRDISDRKQLELALQTSQAQLIEILDRAIAGIIRLRLYPDLSMQFDYISPHYEGIWGFTADDLRSDANYWRSRIHPEDWVNVVLPNVQMIVTQHGIFTYEMEYRFQRRQGSFNWILATCYTQWEAAGGYWDVTVVDTDITDRKAAELALQRSETKFQELAAVSPAVIFTLSVDTNQVIHFDYLSPAAAEIHEIPIAELLREGNLISNQMHPHDREGYHQKLIHCVETMQPFQHEWRIITPSGKTKWLTAYTRPQPREDGHVLWHGITIDISDRKYAELSLQQLNEELELRVEQRTQELLQSERDLRTIFNNVYDAILIHDLDGTILDANDRALEVRGATREQLLSATIPDLSAPDAPLERLPDILRRVQAGETMRFEWKERRFSDHHPFDVEISLRRVMLGNRPVFIAGMRDISDRKRAEIALQESQLFLQTVIDTFPLVVFWKNCDSVYLGCNQRSAQAAGLRSPAEIIGKTDYDMPWGATHAELYRADDQEVLKSGIAKLGIIETQMRSDGSVIWIETNKLPLYNLNGELIGLLGTYQDITDRKQAEQSLRDSESRLAERNAILQSVIESTPDVVFVKDQYGRIVIANSAFVRFFDRPLDTLLGKDDAELWSPEMAHQLRELDSRIMTTGIAETLEERVPHADGLRTYLTTKSPWYDAQGNIIGTIGLSRDISDRKQAEEALQQLNQELEQRVQERTTELQQAMEAAEAANRAKSVFLANMSHELRTPLNAILGFAQLMARDHTLELEKRQQLSIINRSGEHLLNLINDILEMSKIEAGRITFVSNRFHLHSLLDILEEMFQLRAIEKGLQFIIDRRPDLPQHIETDENKLRQVLINLVGNAIKFTQHGQVLLRVSTIPQLAPVTVDPEQPSSALTLQIEVEDTGIGIASTELNSLFEPFIQSNNRQSTQEGTGLGLPISRQFVQLMGGNLTVRSTPGIGSTFAFSIPVQRVESTHQLTSSLPRHILGLAPNQPPYRILVVEDNETNRQLLVQLLQSVGFKVQAATNGQEAIARWETWHPQLIWMDMRMPVMNGYEATEQIRAREQMSGQQAERTKIIALTAGVFEEERTKVLEVGCDDFVRKPFQETELLEKMTTHLGVQYLYAETEIATNRSPTTLDSCHAIAALQELPTPLLIQLHQATVELDNQKLANLIEQVMPTQPQLAALFHEKVNTFDFVPILQLLQAAMPTISEDTA